MNWTISIALVVSMVLGEATYAKTPRSVLKPTTLELKAVSGKAVARLLALSCSDASWQKFVGWARTSGFLNWQGGHAILISMNDGKVSLNETGGRTTEVMRLKTGQLQANFADRTYVGGDTCELINSYLEMPVKASALRAFVIPLANAERVEESKFGDRFSKVVSLALGLGFIGAGIFAGPVGWGYMAFGLVHLTLVGEISKRIETKEEFEKVLNGRFVLTCNKSVTSIKNGAGEIIVRKVPAYQVEFASYNQVTKSNSETFAAVESRQFAMSIASDCNSKEDADKIMAEYGVHVAEARQRIAALDSAGKSPQREGAPQ